MPGVFGSVLGDTPSNTGTSAKYRTPNAAGGSKSNPASGQLSIHSIPASGWRSNRGTIESFDETELTNRGESIENMKGSKNTYIHTIESNFESAESHQSRSRDGQDRDQSLYDEISEDGDEQRIVRMKEKFEAKNYP
jgi:hypothetical protein